MRLSGGSSLFLYRAHFSPCTVQPPFTMMGEFSLIQKQLPTTPFVTSELNGLNLVVTIPAEATTSSKLPAFVLLIRYLLLLMEVFMEVDFSAVLAIGFNTTMRL